MDNGSVTNVLIVGVGGQGIILASEVLSMVALGAGLDVKKSEVHGMAQRGGPVNSQVRFGREVHSPLIPQGEVDVLLSFELVEPLRWIGFLKPETHLISSTQKIHSLTTATTLEKYPDGVEQELKDRFANCTLVDARAGAVSLGDIRVVNVILLGVLARHLPFAREAWLAAVERRVPKKALEINRKAFLFGAGG